MTQALLEYCLELTPGFFLARALQLGSAAASHEQIR